MSMKKAFKFVVFKLLSPLPAIKTAYKVTSGDSASRIAKRWGRVNDVWANAKRAIKHPPIWQTIEELEQDWAITSLNRVTVIRNIKWEILLWLVFALATTFPFISMMLSENILMSITLFKIGLGLGWFLFLNLALQKIVIGVWRLEVLVNRNPINLIEFFKGVDKSAAR